MPNIFSIIGEAWDFYKKQPVLNSIIFWLFALPMGITLSLRQLEREFPTLSQFSFFVEGKSTEQSYAVLLMLIAELFLSIIMLWGTACVLLISKKLLNSKAGRTRSSFRTVRKQAGNFVANLFFTGILRMCFTVFWAVLLIIPGFIYGIRTFFYHVAIVCEDKSYREALNQSKTVVTGQTWTVLGALIGIGLTIYIPLITLTTLITEGIYMFDVRLLIPIHIVSGAIWGIGTAIFTIATVILYVNLKKEANNSPTLI
ncbi:MAG: hypothetical protein KAS32_24370 [Candidatus Peribacteraceae bacterium]|nr:hypothetical protein [Candidatus Peribacteraceae bacterium]